MLQSMGLQQVRHDWATEQKPITTAAGGSEKKPRFPYSLPEEPGVGWVGLGVSRGL